nr:ATP-binding protein [Duganella sp. BJB1802]
MLCTLGLHILFGQLIRSRARAVAANLAKSRFLANMSHELRTPLNGILGYSELLQIEMGASRAGGFADAIHRSGLRLLGLVEAVLELSALESGREPLVVEPMVMAELPQLALSRHREAAVLKGVALNAQMEAGLPAVWPCDRVKLLRILDILLLNAISATAAGSVLLRVAPGPGGGLRCEVRDTGPGVPEAMRRAIFENFSQADDTASRAKEGAGLGLAIATSRLAALMRDRLRLRGKASGGGAVFVVRLPVARGCRTAAASWKPHERPTAPRHRAGRAVAGRRRRPADVPRAGANLPRARAAVAGQAGAGAAAGNSGRDRRRQPLRSGHDGEAGPSA